MLVTSTGVHLYVYSRVPATLVPKMPGMGEPESRNVLLSLLDNFLFAIAIRGN